MSRSDVVVPRWDRRTERSLARRLERAGPARQSRSATWVVGLDLVAKVGLLLMVALVIVNPEYGNLEGKAPVARAVTYPLLALVLPTFWLLSGRDWRRFPVVADLLLTLVCFSDILGNRLDLYDSIVWFDDWMHFMDTAMVAGAGVLLTVPRGAGLGVLVSRAIAIGITAALAWEVFELVSFVMRSPEFPTAYVDTMGDLVLGWCGAVVAALIVHLAWRHTDHAGRRGNLDLHTE